MLLVLYVIPDYLFKLFCSFIGKSLNRINASLISTLLILLFIGIPPSYPDITASNTARPAVTEADNKQSKPSGNIEDNGEIYVFEMSLDELLNVEVKVASLFLEDELVVGSSVIKVSREDWERLGARRYHEALNNEPGIATFMNIGGMPVISVRGYTSNAGATGLSLMVDGVPMTDIALGTATHIVPNWQLGTLDHIEMIKGPGSAVYGSDAFHGVLSLNTFESETDHFSVQVSAAYLPYYQASTQLSRGFAGDRFRLDMAVGYSRQGDMEIDSTINNLDVSDLSSVSNAGYGDYEEVTTRQQRKFQNYSGVAKLTFRPSHRLSSRISGYINDSDSESYPGMGDYPGFDLSAARSKLYLGTGSLSYVFEHEVTLDVAGYFWRANYVSETNAADPLRTFGIPDYGDAYYQYEEVNTRSGINVTVKQPENRWNFQWLTGYSYSRTAVRDTRAAYMRHSTGSTYKYPSGSGTLTGQPVMDAPTDYDGMDREVHSLMLQLKWEAIKNIFILAGGRMDDYSDFGSRITPRAGLIFLPSPSSSVKILYGNAYRIPSQSKLQGLPGNLFAGNENLEPEELDTYELIFINKGKDWRFSANLFYTDWKNAITRTRNPDYDPVTNPNAPQGIYTSNGKNRSYGAELKTFHQLGSIGIDTGFSYVKSEAIDIIDLSTGQKEDQDFKMFPGYILNIGLTYHLKQYRSRIYLNNRYMAKRYDTHYDTIPKSSLNREPEKLPDYWRTDLNILSDITDNLDMIMDVRNLFDRRNEAGAVFGNRNRQGHEEEGISVMLSLRYTH